MSSRSGPCFPPRRSPTRWVSRRSPALPGDFFIALAALALAYRVVIELGKRAFYGAIPAQSAPDKRALGDGRRHLRRRAAHLGHAPAGFAGRAHRLR